MVTIESLEPKQPNINAFNNVLLKYYRNNQQSNPMLELELALGFEKYINNFYNNKYYQNAITQLETSIQRQTVTLDQMTNMINDLRANMH